MSDVFLFGSLSFFSSFAFVSVFMKKAIELGLVDKPNHRSSHKYPTIKGGGLVFSSVYLAFLFYFYFRYEHFQSVTSVLLIFCPQVLILGWLDDRFHLSARLRLVVHILISVLAMLILTKFLQTPIHFLFLPKFFWLNFLFSILYITWFTNLYNFMDGADGLVTLTTILSALALCALCLWSGALELSLIYVLLGASVAGFLNWNWSPARLFMGESGSYFLGINFALLSLIGQINYGIPLYSTIIVLGLFIVDPTYTLIVRVYRKQNPLEAHQHFAFHKLLKRGWSHQAVSFLYAGVALFWLTPLAFLASLFKAYSLPLLVLSYLPLIVYVMLVKAGRD